MTLLRGDTHKFYLKIKKTFEKNKSLYEIGELNEISEIKQFYEKLDADILKKILYRMIKEKNGIGMIPIFISAVPWLLLIFSEQLHTFLLKDGKLGAIIFVLMYIIILIISIVLHYREKAWASIHIEIIQDILRMKNMNRATTSHLH